MKGFLLSLLFCSVLMSAVGFIFMGIERALKNVWSARRRAFVWAVIAVGFLTPVKPRLTDPICTIPVARHSYSAASSAGVVLPDLWLVLFFVWLCGVLLGAGYFLLRHVRFCAYVRRFGVPGGGRCAALAAETARSLGAKTPRVLYLRGVSTPMLTGLFSPTVLLPYRSFQADELRIIFKHELVHYKRRDLWLRLAFLVCRTAHWFNPAVFMFCKAANTACELACDERVTADEPADARKRYCGAILNAAAGEPNGFVPVLASGFGGTKAELKERFLLILNGGRRKRLTALCVLAAAAVAFSGAVLAIQTQDIASNTEEVSTWAVTAPYGDTGDTEAEASYTATTVVGTTSTDQTDSAEETNTLPTQAFAARTTYPYIPTAEQPMGLYETTTVRVP